MTDEEREKKIVDEKKARAEAVALLCRAPHGRACRSYH